MHSLTQDLRYGLRLLAKQPAFNLLAVLTLALGIGAATTIFSVIQGVLFDPFPGHDVDRVVAFHIVDPARPEGSGRSVFQVPEFLDYQEQVQSFEEVIAGANEAVLFRTGEGTEQWNGGLVSPNNFSLLGVPAALGRTLLPEDARSGAPPVFVMTHKLWAGRFGHDPPALGRVFVLNDVPTTLVGVMPPNFAKLGAEIYRPLALDRGNIEQAQQFFLLQARLKRGVTLAQAEADITVVARRLAQQHPRLYPPNFTVKVRTLLDSVIGPFRKTLYTLAAAVGLLLLIACSNVANMLLSRAAAREREMAVRASLGATRSRLLRQLLAESLVLALAGAVAGCLFAALGVKGLVAAMPEFLIPRQAVIQLSVPVLLFSLLTAAATALLCGLVPALQTARRDLADPLRDSGKGSSVGRRHRWTNALVVSEVALSLVLLTGAGLLIKSFANLQTVELGMDPEGVLHTPVRVPQGAYATPAARHQFLRQVTERVAALPGVVSVSPATGFPPYGGLRSEVAVTGRALAERAETMFQLVGEGYARTLRLRMRTGRFLSEVDVADGRKVALVNETFAARYLAGGNPIGQTIELKRLATLPPAPALAPAFEVVGVLADAKNQGVQDAVQPEVFVPYTVTAGFERGLVVRTSIPPSSMIEAVKREIWAVDKSAALTRMITLPEALRQYSYAQPRFVMLILGVFAGLGLALVAVGVFGVIAYAVSRRTREIGVRMALGARRLDILRMVLDMGLRLVGVGLALGVVASLTVTRVLSNQLFGVRPNDPMTLLAVVAVVALAGIAAALVPARRATRVDPLVALRYE